MNLLWLLSDRDTHVHFCWIPSHCGIEGNWRVDQLAKGTLKQDIDPLASIHYTDWKPLVNSYIQQLVQTRWDVALHVRDLYLINQHWGNRINSRTEPELKRLWPSNFELSIPRPPSPILFPEDIRLLVTTVVNHLALSICSWSVQYYRNALKNTTQLTHWIPSLRQFLRLAK